MKLNPILRDKIFVFVETDIVPDGAIATFVESEGTTVIIAKDLAEKSGYKWEFEAAWITLSTETSLTDLGITAKFSKALSDNGISCNVFAAIHHDHIFVPWDKRLEALEVLKELEL